MDMSNHTNYGIIYIDGRANAMCHTCNTRTPATGELVEDVKKAHQRHQMDVARQAKYDAYLRVCSVGHVSALSFSAWMVKRGFAYSSVDQMWVLV